MANDALTLLKHDHQVVKELLEKIAETSEKSVKTRAELFDKVKFLIKAHKLLEEKLFYPVIKEQKEILTLTLEAYEEHDLVDEMLKKMDSEEAGSPEWIAKFKVMKELLEHHVKEEEDEIFPLVKKHVPQEQLTTMAEKMQALKEEADKG